MEIIKYDKQQRLFRQRLRAFLEKEVAPYADQWEKDRIVPKSVWRKMAKEGEENVATKPPGAIIREKKIRSLRTRFWPSLLLNIRFYLHDSWPTIRIVCLVSYSFIYIISVTHTCCP